MTRLCGRYAKAVPHCVSPRAIVWRVPVERTAPYVYARLRKETYHDAALNNGPSGLARVGAGADEIYVYFKHETGAPKLAARLAEMLDDGDAHDEL